MVGSHIENVIQTWKSGSLDQGYLLHEPVSKLCSAVKIKAGDHFNRRFSSATSRIEM